MTLENYAKLDFESFIKNYDIALVHSFRRKQKYYAITEQNNYNLEYDNEEKNS